VGKAKILLDQRIDLSERYRVELKVLGVEPSPRFPEGINVSYVLLDVFDKVPRLLVDNHAPEGFHVHTELPHNKQVIRILKGASHIEALDEFWRLVKETVENEG